jgi:hypothetical protein
VTNIKVKKLDVISTAVTLLKSGEVLKVQRVTVIVMDMYQLKEFPFDMQDLAVDIASTQYMTNAVQLVPNENPSWTGVSSTFFDGSGFALKHWSLFRVEDDQGVLKKSRGILSMKVQRVLTSYMSQNFIPMMYIVAFSCAVFYFPCNMVFIMPRLATSIVSYLTFSNLAAKSDAALPSTRPNNWNDVLCQNIQLVMLITTCFNIYSELLFHAFGIEDFATKITNELKFIAPLLNIFVAATIMICGAAHTDQTPVDIVVKVLVVLNIIAYIVFCELRKKEVLRTKADAAIAEACNSANEKAYAAADDKSDASSEKSVPPSR